MSHRKAGEEKVQIKRANEMMEKLERSKEVVENFMKDRNHQNMIDQEERRLQEEDIRTCQERTKRLKMR